MSKYISALDAVVAEEVNQAVGIAVEDTRTTDVNMVLSIINNSDNVNKNSHELTKLILERFKDLE